MTLWTGQRVGVEPDTANVPRRTYRACSRCWRPVLVPVARMWYPITCRRCGLRAGAADFLLRVLCTIGAAAFVSAWVWLILAWGGR